MKPDEIALTQLLDTLRESGVAYREMSDFIRPDTPTPICEMFKRWISLKRRLYFVKGTGFIYINVRSEPPGWWGLDDDVLEDLDQISVELGIPYKFLLIVRKKDRSGYKGYLCTNFDEKPFSTRPESKNGKYNVYEAKHLSPAFGISFPNLAGKLRADQLSVGGSHT